MRLIGKAVHEGGGALFEGLDDARGDEDGAEGRVTAGNSLPSEDDVRFETPVLAGERLSRAAYTAHDFIGDEQDAVLAADFGNARSVAVDGGGSTERGADDRFEDKGSDSGGIVGAEENVEIVSAGEIAFGINFAERAVVAETRCDVAPLRNHRRIRSAAANVAADGHGTQRAAVITLLAGNDAVTGALLAFEKILPRQFDGCFRGFGAPGGEVDAAAIVEIAWSDGEHAGGQFFCRFGVELGGVGERDAAGLLGHGAPNFRDTVADADYGSLAGGV